MLIAILSWGSLIWKPESLPFSRPWKEGGPTLSLEFSRITEERPLTIVLDPDYGVPCPTRFAFSLRTHLADAIADLKQREGTTEEHIGYIDMQHDRSSIHEYPHQINVEAPIQQWCEQHQIPAAVWTAIPPNFSQCLGINFSVDGAMQYLKDLSVPQQESTLEYIRNTPEEIVTPLRREIEREWPA
ncbi:hypothetical protein IFO70_23270 [Phormidium tenue FACHB-886]|nr:hypothetical protein [Phormidium tenue FACHB-886]